MYDFLQSTWYTFGFLNFVIDLKPRGTRTAKNNGKNFICKLVKHMGWPMPVVTVLKLPCLLLIHTPHTHTHTRRLNYKSTMIINVI